MDIEKLEAALDPRQWTHEMSVAWHRSIPDVQAAFRNLRAAALGLPQEYPYYKYVPDPSEDAK